MLFVTLLRKLKKHPCPFIPLLQPLRIKKRPRHCMQVNDALLSAGIPVCLPLPAAAIHMDMQSARLELLIPKVIDM